MKGRGAGENPAGRFEKLDIVYDDPAEIDGHATEFLRDDSRTVLASNDSPDVPFERSLNPYRGCEHGCAYCYARPTHEYLGFSAGLDFESKILVKEKAATLLREELSSPSWKPQIIALSGVTDPYQPAERRLALTRACLEVLAEFRNPVGIVTKSHLVTRDVDLLSRLHEYRCASVILSVTSLDSDLSRRLEPRAASPARRLDAVSQLAAAGVPVGVNVAPVIPGLTDHEIPSILKAGADAGAVWAGYIVLRLPHGVKDLFVDWLGRHRPERQSRVVERIRDVRSGKLYDSDFRVRMRGAGLYAEQIQRLFDIERRKAGLARRGPALETCHFRRPACSQLDLF